MKHIYKFYQISMIDIFLSASKNTIIHIILIFGLTGIITLLLFLLQRMICIALNKTTGWKGVYITAWIGTPVHEFSHALFCIVFGHKIQEVAFFKPDKASGVLGYVSHNYNTKSIYQSVGNFFIGIAPLLIGSLILFLLFDTFFPDQAAKTMKSNIDINNLNASFTAVFKEFYAGIVANFSVLRSTLLKPGLLSIAILYLMTSISAHIAPSHVDLKNALPGFGLLIGLIFIFNLVSGFLNFNPGLLLSHITTFLGKLHSILIFGLALTIFSFILIYIPLAIYYLLKNKRILNPFF